MLRVLANTLLVVSVWSLAAATHAEETGSWQYQCLGDEVVGSRICTTEFATFEDGQEFVLYFVRTEKGASPFVVASEDDAMSAVAVIVDDNDPVAAESCADGACYFSAQDSSLLLKQFRKGRTAHVTIRAGAERIMFERSLTLRGFSAAYAQSGT